MTDYHQDSTRPNINPNQLPPRKYPVNDDSGWTPILAVLAVIAIVVMVAAGLMNREPGLEVEPTTTQSAPDPAPAATPDVTTPDSAAVPEPAPAEEPSLTPEEVPAPAPEAAPTPAPNN